MITSHASSLALQRREVPLDWRASQLIASMAVLITSVVAGLWIAAKLLRIYLLMYGKRPRLREIVRALRAG